MIASEIRAEARKSLTGKWGKGALLTLAFAVVTYLITLVLTFVPVVGYIANLVITPALSFGYLIGFIKLRRGEDVGYFDFFKNGFAFFGKLWSVIGYTLLKMILPIVAIIVSIIILAIGGVGSVAAGESFGIVAVIGIILYIVALIWTIVKGYSYVLTQFLLYDNQDMEAKAIVEKSEELMKGHKWAYFWLPLTFLGWVILSVFTLYIGLLWIIPYMQIAMVIFYENIAGKVESTIEVEDNGPISE